MKMMEISRMISLNSPAYTISIYLYVPLANAILAIIVICEALKLHRQKMKVLTVTGALLSKEATETLPIADIWTGQRSMSSLLWLKCVIFLVILLILWCIKCGFSLVLRCRTFAQSSS